MLTPKELATVLAALRHWQDLEKRDPQAGKFIAGSDREGTFFEEHDPLTVEEIDSLCERLNCSPEENRDYSLLALEAAKAVISLDGLKRFRYGLTADYDYHAALADWARAIDRAWKSIPL